MKIKELLYSRRGIGLALISLSAAATLYWFLRRRKAAVRSASTSKKPHVSTSKATVTAQPATPTKSKPSSSSKSVTAPKSLPRTPVKKTEDDVPLVSNDVPKETSPLTTPSPIVAKVPDILKSVDPQTVKPAVSEDTVDRVKTPLPVHRRHVAESPKGEPLPMMSLLEAQRSPAVTDSVGKLVDEPIVAPKPDILPPSSAPVVVPIPVPPSEPPVSAVLVVTPLPQAVPPPSDPTPPVLSTLVPPASTPTPPPTPEPDASEPPKDVATLSDALSDASHITLSAVSPSTSSYQPRTMCDCRVSRDLDKILKDDDEFLLFDDKIKFVPTPTFVFPISFDRHIPQNLIEVTDELSTTHISKSAQKRSTQHQSESILTPFSPILNSLVNANKHAHVINELVTNYQYLE